MEILPKDIVNNSSNPECPLPLGLCLYLGNRNRTLPYFIDSTLWVGHWQPTHARLQLAVVGGPRGCGEWATWLWWVGHCPPMAHQPQPTATLPPIATDGPLEVCYLGYGS